MFYLAGILGMMMIGSIAVIATGTSDDDGDDLSEPLPEPSDIDDSSDDLLEPLPESIDTDDNNDGMDPPIGSPVEPIPPDSPVDTSDDPLPPQAPGPGPGLVVDGPFPGDTTFVEEADSEEVSIAEDDGIQGDLDDPSEDQPHSAAPNLVVDGVYPEAMNPAALIFGPGTDVGAGFGSSVANNPMPDPELDLDAPEEGAMFGGAGDDNLTGDEHGNHILGDAGNDTLSGGDNADTLGGGADNDLINGGNGNDQLDGGAGSDLLQGRAGADTLTGGLGQDTLFGGAGDDVLSGVVQAEADPDADEADFLNGEEGEDRIEIGSQDIVTGGAGNDMLLLGDWIDAGPAELLDYDRTEDQLLVIFDDTDSDEDPVVTLGESQMDPTRTEIRLNGVALAILPTDQAPLIEDVVMIGSSSAGALLTL